jgi:UDP:flavonoid glycosyltransferase YjiC (YdhE family)
MKILFFPSDLGGGFGHVSRCIALADQARERGHCCAFVLNDQKFEKRVAARFPVDIVKPHRGLKKRLMARFFDKRRSDNSNKPLYLGISGLDFQVIRDGLATGKAIEHTLYGYRRRVRSFKADLLIGDINLLVGPLSRMVNLPSVQVVRYAFHPDTANLIWWQDVPNGIEAPETLGILNPTLRKMGLGTIGTCYDLLRGDLYVVPSIPEIEPIPGETPNTEHVGPLVMRSDQAKSHAALDSPSCGTRLIYVTIGGGAGPVGNQQLFANIITALRDYPAQVIISTGGKFDWAKPFDLPPNIQMFDWVPADRIIPVADLIIFHGGYGTMMETLAAGKPSIVIPFHTEQESNGRRLEQLGCGRVLKLSKQPFSTLRAQTSCGEYSYVIQNRYDMEAQELLEAVDTVMTDRRSADAARRLQARIQAYRGAQQAMDLIEHHFG